MRYFAFATDYDGTLAHHSTVSETTVDALKRLRASGRKLIMVTGRELPDLQRVCPHLHLFDLIVAENGALLYDPAKQTETPLAEAPPPNLARRLHERGVAPLSVGRVIVATWTPHEQTVLQTIQELGLELHVIFNKGAVMILPSGVNKATGLEAALKELGLSAHNVVGVGDAENDHAFLHACECSVAVSNALPALKDKADWVTQRDHGDGVTDLLNEILRDDLASIAPCLHRNDLHLGELREGEPFNLRPYGVNVLIAGTSGGGKSTLATMFVEKLAAQNYQFCVLDPEGDYHEFQGAVVVGDPERPPQIDQVIKLLEQGQNCAVNLLGVELEDRPAFFDQMLPALLDLRARTGRPHWIILDEIHHLSPAEWEPASSTMPEDISGIVLITCYPDHIAPVLMEKVNLILTIGEEPAKTVATFSKRLGEEAPHIPNVDLQSGEVIAWWRKPAREPFWFKAHRPTQEMRRHLRKYAAGELAEQSSFFFRGPGHKLNLRAQNLIVFLQMADGVDDATWEHHLRHGDYSKWMREIIKDAPMADEAAHVEQNEDVDAKASRGAIRKIVEKRYTAPA